MFCRNLGVLGGCLFFITLVGACARQDGNVQQGLAAAVEAPRRPNILLIVADDLGYSDIGSYGGEIQTPVLDKLAQDGVRFADFTVAPSCSTTRSMLLSGVDNHLNGLGGLDTSGRPKTEVAPGYEGFLNFDVVTFTSLLQRAGYRTYMAGKWHLGTTLETGPEARGFDRAFVNPRGAGDHFSDRAPISSQERVAYREDGKPATVPKDFYSTTFFTDKIIEYIEADRDRDQPFFVYAAYTAPHWPLQAPDEFIDKYDGVYEAGYDAIRDGRLQRLKDLGLVHNLPDLPMSGLLTRPWDSLDDATRARESRRMQVYAGMVTTLDHHIGRLLAYLDRIGERDNTVIIFLSDNGAEGNDPYVIVDNRNWIPKNFATDTASLGKPGSYSAYGPAWAEVSATPFRLYKTFTAEGGIRVPGIFVLPDMPGTGRLSHSFATVLDIAPTILELARVPYPDGSFDGRKIHPLQGQSMVPYLMGKTERIHPADHVMGWELYNRRALRQGDWKLLWIASPYSIGRWELYNLADDPYERHDLAVQRPDILTQMIGHWDDYAAANNVILEDYSKLKYGNENHHYDH